MLVMKVMFGGNVVFLPDEDAFALFEERNPHLRGMEVSIEWVVI